MKEKITEICNGTVHSLTGPRTGRLGQNWRRW